MGCHASKDCKESVSYNRRSADKDIADALNEENDFERQLSSGSTGNIVEPGTLRDFNTRSRYSHRAVDQDFIVEPTKVLGEGVNGFVTKASNRFTGQECALKVLQKKGIPPHRLDNLRSEVNNYLKIDHPHIARLLHVYEDRHGVSLVMELCSGKELFDRIADKSRLFGEREAMHATYQILLAIAYLHKHNIVHCDLKLENILYDKDSACGNAHLKLIDFGFSKVWDHHEAIHTRQGSPCYAAPEVFSGNYTDKCDLWALGVIVFILLSGTPPFSMKDEEECQRNVMLGRYRMPDSRWEAISESAKDFVRKLLVVNPDDRMSADQALKHPWLSNELSADIASPTVATSDALLGDLRRYSKCSHLKRAMLSMMAHHVSSPDLEQIQETFLSLDIDKTGTISRNSFRVALSGRLDLGEEEIGRLFDCVDTEHDGEIQFSEFTAAVMQSRVKIDKKLIWETFELFNVSRTGHITRADLETVFGASRFEETDIDTLMHECGGDEKKGISFEQFEHHLRGYNNHSFGLDSLRRRRSLVTKLTSVMSRRKYGMRSRSNSFTSETTATTACSASGRRPSAAGSVASETSSGGPESDREAIKRSRPPSIETHIAACYAGRSSPVGSPSPVTTGTASSRSVKSHESSPVVPRGTPAGKAGVTERGIDLDHKAVLRSAPVCHPEGSPQQKKIFEATMPATPGHLPSPTSPVVASEASAAEICIRVISATSSTRASL
jgi:calcium-dependent protein kinase